MKHYSMRQEKLAKMLIEMNEHNPVYEKIIQNLYHDLLSFSARKKIYEDVDLLISYQDYYYFKSSEIQIGDYVLLSDGNYMQVTGVLYDKIQVSYGHYCCFGKSNSYSGTSDNLYNKSSFVLTDKMKVGKCWFFHEDISGEGREVQAVLNFKVWSEIR
jgi:hypothetical protein